MRLRLAVPGLALLVSLVVAPAALANPPVASFTMSPETPVAGQSVTFDGSASTADHMQRRSYYWFIDQPPNSTTHLPPSTSPTLTRTFTAGTHTVDLIVADDMCLEPPAGDNCYSAKATKSFTVTAASGGGGDTGGGTGGGGSPPPSDPRLQIGDTGDSLQAGTAAANLQIGGGGRDRQRGAGGNDVQLPDAKASAVCAARIQALSQLTAVQRAITLPTLRRVVARMIALVQRELNALVRAYNCSGASRRSVSASAAAFSPVDDRLDGGSGSDLQSAGAGNDVVVGGSGADIMLGGSGRDEMRSRDSSRDVVSCGAGRDLAIVDKRDIVTKDCEQVRKR